MKNLFYSIMCLAAMVFAVSCEGGSKEPEGTKLTAPVLGEATTTENSFTIAWQAVEGAVGYTYMVNGENPTDITDLTVTVSDLTPGSYNFRVRANAEDAALNSAWAQKDIKIEKASNPGDDVVVEEGSINDFAGTYTLTAAGEITIADAIEYNEASEPYEQELSIEVADEANQIVAVDGWLNEAITGGESFQIPTWYDLQLDEEGNTAGHTLTMINQVEVMEPDAEGYTGCMLSMCDINDGDQITLVTGQFRAVEVKQTQNGLKFETLGGDLRDGSTFVAVQYYLYALNADAGMFAYYGDPVFPAAPYSAVKTAATPSAKIASAKAWSGMRANIENAMRVSVAK